MKRLLDIAVSLLALLVLLLLGQTRFAVMLNEQTGEFTSALAARDETRFWDSIQFCVVLLLMAVPMVFGAGNLNPVLGIGMLVAMPFLYALVGFLFTLLGAWVYNLVAAQTGGIEYTSVTATGD